MGFMEKILGGESRSVGEYAELDIDDVQSPDGATTQVHIAEIGDNEDVIDIKDAVYDGDLVVADITRLRTEDATVERITDELSQVAAEVGGDIVQKGDDQLIVTPAGISISRRKLGRNR